MKNLYLATIVTILFTAFTLGVKADAATFYVATSGNDTNTGTLSKPFKTIKKAITKISSGDTVAIRAGTYNEIVEVTKSGIAGNPITLKSYNGESVIIKSPDWAGIYLSKVNYVTISGLKITGMTHDGVHISGGKYNIVKNVEVYGNTNSSGVGIHISSKNGTSGNNKVTGCKIHDIKAEAIYVDIKSASPNPNDTNIIENNTIYNAKEGIQNTNENGKAPFPKGTIIRGNVISNISDGDWAVMDLSGDNLTVTNNTITKSLAGIGGIWYTNGSGTKINGNKISDNTSRFANGGGITVKKVSNIIINSNTISNQKILNSTTKGIALIDVGKDVTVRENVISGVKYAIAKINDGSLIAHDLCKVNTCNNSATPVPASTPAPTPTPAPAPAPNPSTKTVIYNANFESGDWTSLTGPNPEVAFGNGLEGPLGAYFGKGAGWKAELVKSPAKGNYSAALTINSGDTTAAYLFTYKRTSKTVAEYSADYFVPSNVTPADWWNVWQWKSQNLKYPKPIFDLNLLKVNGVLQLLLVHNPGGIVGNTQDFYQTKPIAFPTDRWVNIKGIYKAVNDNTGYVEIYQDGVKILEKATVNTKPNNESVLWSINSYADAISPNPATIYIDNMKISE